MITRHYKHCYRSYYTLYVTPLNNRQARVHTCCHNVFREGNAVIVENDVAAAWNSINFQHQRKLISKNDWSFCYGASCSPLKMHDIEKDSAVCEAVTRRQTTVAYLPKVIFIYPSLACNNNCYFCIQHGHYGDTSDVHLSNGIMSELKDTLIPQATYIVISGGEPFFSPRAIELINWIITHYPEKKLIVQTNGVLLSQFGITRVIQHISRLDVSLFGMKRETYRNVTENDNYDVVFKNIHTLIDAQYRHVRVIFIVSRKTIQDIEDFCRFISKNKILTGIVTNNVFENRRQYKIMKQYEERFSYLQSRLQFLYNNEGLSRCLLRKAYNPVHSFKYAFSRITSRR